MSYDNFAYIAADHNPTGFTNNWLESRKPEHYFDQNYSDFKLYDEPRAGNNSYRDIIKTMVERSPVGDLFFSEQNMRHLKNLICKSIYKQSGGKYNVSPESQSDNELLLVMRSVYLDHARHLPDKVREQVGELNLQVLMDMVPRCISLAQQHLSYIRDSTQQPLPMDRSQYVSSAGTRSNRSVTTTFI